MPYPSLLLLLSPLLFGIFSNAAADDDKPSPRELPHQELLDAIGEGTQKLNRADQAFKGAKESVDRHLRTLEEAAQTEDVETFETIPSLESLTTSDAEGIAKHKARCDELLEAYHQRLRRRDEALAGLKGLDEVLPLLPEHAKKVRDAAVALRPLLVEGQERLSTGTITEEEFEATNPGLDLPRWIDRCDQHIDNVEASPTHQPESLDALRTSAQSLPGEDGELAAQLELACAASSRLLDLVRLQARLEGDSQSPGETPLTSDLPLLLDAYAFDCEFLADSESKLETQRQDVQRLRDSLDEATAPEPQVQGTGDPLARARQQKLHTEATIEFLSTQRSTLESLNASRSALIDVLNERDEIITDAIDSLVPLRAALATLEGPPPQGTPSETESWASLKDLVLLEARTSVLRETLQARLEDKTPLAALDDEIAQAQRRANLAKRNLEEEESYAVAVAEMAARESEALIASLSPEGDLFSQLTQVRASLDEHRQTLGKAEEESDRARRQIRSIENPLTLAASRRLENEDERPQTLNQEIEELAPGAMLPDHSTEYTSIEDDAESSNQEHSTPDKKDNPSISELAEEEQARLRAQHIRAGQVLQYFEALGTATATFRDCLDKREAAITLVQETLSEIVKIERRKYACAKELERRRREGSVSREVVPRTLRRMAKRKGVLDAERDVSRFREEQLQGVEERRRDLQRLETIASWKTWAAIVEESYERKLTLIGNPVSYLSAAAEPLDQLDDVDRKNVEYLAATLPLQEGSSEFQLDVLSGFVAKDKRNLFEGPLEAYRLELVDTQRRSDALRRGLEGYEKLIEVSDQEQEALRDAPAALREAMKQREFDYQVARYQATIAAAPEFEDKHRASFRERFDRELPLMSEERELDLEPLKEELLASEARLLGHSMWLAKYEHRLSKRGVEAEVGRFRSDIGQIGATLDLEDKNAAGLRDRIRDLEHAYAKEVTQHIGFALGEVLLVILVAYVVQKVLKLASVRLNRRFEPSTDEDRSDRQKRMQTVTKTMSATITVLVWVVTAIYVMSLLGVDVTPIIASASVLGLAVAFGAQAMFKDFFSGFFILLENQYTIGDIVDVGGISGTVERLSLRVTVLRDIEGIVHYIPNGTVDRVSNKTQNWSRVVMDIGVGYGEELDRVTAVISEVLNDIKSEPPWSHRILEPPVVAGVEALADSSVNVRVMAKTRPGRQWEVAREIRRRVKIRFDREGIEIPFPQRVVHHIHSDKNASASDSKDSIDS